MFAKILLFIIEGLFAFLAGKLTVAVLKSFRKKRTSKIMAGTLGSLVKRAPKMSLDELDDIDEDDVILAEYDTDKDDLVQDIKISKDVDARLRSIVEDNGGIVVLE